MHSKAKAWNLTHYPHLDGKCPHHLIPFDRPCDWCGKIVGIGYIHDGKCRKEEMSFYLDIFN